MRKLVVAFALGGLVLVGCGGSDPAPPPTLPSLTGTWSVSTVAYDGTACTGSMTLAGTTASPVGTISMAPLCPYRTGLAGTVTLVTSNWSSGSGTVLGSLASIDGYGRVIYDGATTGTTMTFKLGMDTTPGSFVATYIAHR